MAQDSQEKSLALVLSEIVKKYERYNNNELSFDELYDSVLVTSLRKLTIESQFKNSLSDSDVESLNLLLINIRDRYQAYTYHNDLGNDMESRKERREAIAVAGRIVKKLETILEDLSIKGKSAEDEASNLKLDSIAEDLSLKDDDWDDLTYQIRRQCVPFVGSDIWSSSGPLSNLAEDWSSLYDYPFEDSTQLSRVAEFIAIEKGDPMYPKRMLSKMLTEIKPPDFSKVKESPYLTLAGLNVPIFITTNYDHFLEEALRFKNKRPKSEICRWNDDLRTWLEIRGATEEHKHLRSVFKSKYKPSREEPVVYHLHGDIDVPQSLVLTERDYIQFVINLSKEKEKDILPSAVRSALATSSLIFVGYNLEQLNFRIIFQSVLGLQVGDLRGTSISVQLPPLFSENKQKKALRYLREYIKDKKVRVYWGNSESFFKDLGEHLPELKALV
jgi:hypothetical protein